MHTVTSGRLKMHGRETDATRSFGDAVSELGKALSAVHVSPAGPGWVCLMPKPPDGDAGLQGVRQPWMAAPL